jgi:hypothetical protein
MENFVDENIPGPPSLRNNIATSCGTDNGTKRDYGSVLLRKNKSTTGLQYRWKGRGVMLDRWTSG